MTRSLLILIVTLTCQSRCAAQSLKVDLSLADGAGYWTKWDSVQDRVILYRAMAKDTRGSGAPAARIIQKDGTSIAVYPQMDLPGSQFIDVWDAAATPDGGVVLAVIVGYTPRSVQPAQLKEFLLTYEGTTGKLTKVWDIFPYDPWRVAVDRDGNVFSLADSAVFEPYPLLVKYSPNGVVLRTFLDSSIFGEGEGALANDSRNGDCQLFIKSDNMGSDHLFAWIPRSQELFEFSLAGDLLRRKSLASALSGLAASTSSDHVRVQSLTTNDRAEAIAQVQLLPKRATDPVRNVMINVSADGSRATIVSAPPNEFLGTTSQGGSVFLQLPQRGSSVGTITQN